MPYCRCPACGLLSYSAAAYSTVASCPDCSAALPVGSALHLAPETGLDCVVRARPEGVAEARRALIGLALSDVTRGKLALLVSELVTNSVRHAGLSAEDAVSLQVTSGAGHVRLAVHDAGHGFVPSSPEDRDPLGVGGQGLVLVAALSDTWGVDCDDSGCSVWCEVVTEDAPAAIERKVAGRYAREAVGSTSVQRRSLLETG
jgi:anti-sigma regulatory factor (Ser/Thr protein kinase)